MKGVLFLCVANSARSQMAEGIARTLLPDQVQVFSAGSDPARVNPLAIEAMTEIGIDIRDHRSKGFAEVPLDAIDTVVTLCQEEICPTVPVRTHRLHWALPDPAAAEGTDAERLQAFRDVRDQLSALLPRELCRR